MWFDELHNKYHNLFDTYEEDNDYHKKGQILRGIECGEGWKHHIINFLEALQYCQENNCKEDEQIKIFQIKEKFGHVRTYVDGPDRLMESISQYIGRLEGACDHTCESCGTMGYDMIKKHKGWIHCLCKECSNAN